MATIDELLKSLKSLHKLLECVNNYNVKVKCLTTLPNEHVNSRMRMRYPMPTHFQYCQAFVPVVEESIKQLCDCGFIYFTSRNTHYEQPDESRIPFTEMPTVHKPPTSTMAVADQHRMKEFAEEHGKPVRQMTVRQMTTMDKPGTMPISVYRHSSPVINPMDRTFLESQEVLPMQVGTTWIVKKEDVDIEACLGDFMFFRVVQNDGTCIRFSVYIQDQINCFLYTKQTAISLVRNVLPSMYEIHCSSVDDEHVELNETEYETIKLLLGVNEEDTTENSDSDDSIDESIPVPQVSRRTGRIIKLPARYMD